MPPLPPLPPETQARFFVRRLTGQITGPHDKPVLVEMIASGALSGSEEIAIDRRTWKPIALLVGSVPSAKTSRGVPSDGSRLDFIDLPVGNDAGSLDAEPAANLGASGTPSPAVPHSSRMASLDLGAPPARSDAERGGPSSKAPGRVAVGGTRPATVAPSTRGSTTALTNLFEERRTASRAIPVVTDMPGVGLDAPATPGADGDAAPGLSLELVERKPAHASVATQAKFVSSLGPDAAGNVSRTAAPSLSMRVPLKSFPELAAPPPTDIAAGAGTGAIEVKAPPRPRQRTVTAARPGLTAGVPSRRLPTRSLIVIAAAVVGAGALVAAAVVFEIPSRLRPEPKIPAVLGAVAADIQQDRFSAFSEGARRLEDSVADRKRAPVTRAEAALLLATSVVVHGGERGRLAHAEALLPAAEATEGASSRAAGPIARARAWIALGKGRTKEAEALATDQKIADADRSALRGWAAIARQDFAAAETAFTAAEAAVPSPAPSKIAARFALALSREATFAPTAATTYRAVLAEAPGHFGAALGLLRTAHLPADERLKTVQALIANQARDASPAERGDAQVRLAEAARDLGDRAAADAALARARAVDPSGVALAVALGDRALGDGREDEAASHYKAALAASPAVPRTPALQFARVAAFLDAGRTAEGVAALERLERGLPGDARASFWRGHLAEHAKVPDVAAAEQAYLEALKRDAKFFPASLDLARLRLGRHRTQDALAVLKRAEAQGTAPVALRMALGEALLAAGNAVEAVRAFRQAQGDDRKSPAAALGLANALYAIGDAGGANTELTAVAARGDTAKLGARIGELFVKLGHRPEALAAYQREIAAGGAAADTKVAAARLALDLGDKDAAQKLAEGAVDDDPRTPGALFVLAEVLRSKGDLARAVAELRRAQAVDGSPEVQLEYGRILASLGRDDEAMTALLEAKEIPEAGIERGRINLRRGNLDKAIEELQAATVKLPTNADAFLLLGQAQDRLGQGDKAEATFRTAARLAPTLGEVRYRLGRMLLDRGVVAAALPHLRAAADHVPTAAQWRADVYFQLGFAEQRQGARDKATAAFRRYLELAPADAPARAEVLKQLDDAER